MISTYFFLLLKNIFQIRDNLIVNKKYILHLTYKVEIFKLLLNYFFYGVFLIINRNKNKISLAMFGRSTGDHI